MLVVSSRPVGKKDLQAREQGILPCTIRKGVILPLASCAYPVPKLSSSMQAERLELIFLPQRSRLVVRINILARLALRL